MFLNARFLLRHVFLDVEVSAWVSMLAERHVEKWYLQLVDLSVLITLELLHVSLQLLAIILGILLLLLSADNGSLQLCYELLSLFDVGVDLAC